MRPRIWWALLAAGCGDPAGGADSDPGFTTIQVLRQDADITASRVSYRSGALTVRGIVCRPNAPGTYPLLMVNHGGWAGLTTELNPATSGCVGLARAGFVAIEPSYRGEDGSEGSIELCLGEADDIRAMLAIAIADPSVDRNRVAIVGGSHGGCSTLRALADGAPAARVVSVAGPTEWAETYQALVDSIAAGATGARLAGFDLITADTRRYLGGTPAQVPAAYQARSIRARVTALDRYPGALLIQHGVDDEIVTVQEACALVAGAAGFTAYHVTEAGQVVTTAPPPCAATAITWSPGPLPTRWPAQRYLVVYDALGHGGGPNAPRQNEHAFQFLFPQ